MAGRWVYEQYDGLFQSEAFELAMRAAESERRAIEAQQAAQRRSPFEVPSDDTQSALSQQCHGDAPRVRMTAAATTDSTATQAQRNEH